jgi:hypothetical protein
MRVAEDHYAGAQAPENGGARAGADASSRANFHSNCYKLTQAQSFF